MIYYPPVPFYFITTEQEDFYALCLLACVKIFEIYIF